VRPRLSLIAVVILSVALAVVASPPGSPFTPPLYPGGAAPGWLRGVADLLGLDALSREVVAVIGGVVIFALTASFLFALRSAWRREISMRSVLLVGVALHLLALAMPLFLSRDVYSYAIYGRMVSEHGANPYVDIPAAFPDDPTYPLVSVDWIDSPSVYGPAFTATAGAVTAVADSPAGIVSGFKLLAFLASVGTMFLVVPASRRVFPERATFAAMLVGWNPVVVFHGVAGGHNDALLGLAIAGGVLALLARRELLASGLLSLGALVKVSGGVPLLVAVAGAVARRRPGDRFVAGAKHVGLAATVALPFVLPFMQTEDPTLGTLELTSREGWLAPSRFVLSTLRSAARAVGGDAAGDFVSILVRAAFPLLFLWVLVGVVRHLARDPARIDPPVVLAAMGWVGLVSLLVSPVLLPWYAVWVIPMAWALPRTARGGVVVISMALAITELVAEPSRSPGVYEAMVFGLHWVATPVVLWVLIRLVLELRRRLRAGPAAGLDDPLLSEEVPSGSGAGAPRSDVAARGEGDDERQRAHAAGQHADAVSGDRRQDRHRDAH
jgi:hypothetical protein